MLLLGIETATRRVGVVLASDDGMLARVELGGYADHGPPRHAEQLAPAIEYCCAEIGTTLDHVSAIAVGTGPGLFTGLRVGVTTAKTFAYAAGAEVIGVSTLEAANQYLEQEFLPWWNAHLTVVPASAADAHRALGPEHGLASALSHVEQRRVAQDYTFSYYGKKHLIAPQSIQPGLRGGTVRIERRLDGSLAVRFKDKWLQIGSCRINRSGPACGPGANDHDFFRHRRSPT